MAAIQTGIVAGPFKATYVGPGGSSNPASASLGIIGSRGIRQIRKYEGEDIVGDLLGSSVIESVYLGGQMFLEFELEEANLQNVMALQNPFTAGNLGNPTVDLTNEVGVPGTLATSKAGSLILHPLFTGTSNLHTTAGAGQGGAGASVVRTYGLVTLAMGFDMETLLASKRRVIPIRLRCYPYSDGGSPAKYIWFSKSTMSGTYNVV